MDTSPPVHDACSMKHRLCRITLTMEDSLLRRARREAARKVTSLSRFLGEVLKKERESQILYRR